VIGGKKKEKKRSMTYYSDFHAAAVRRGYRQKYKGESVINHEVRGKKRDEKRCVTFLTVQGGRERNIAPSN